MARKNDIRQLDRDEFSKLAVDCLRSMKASAQENLRRAQHVHHPVAVDAYRGVMETLEIAISDCCFGRMTWNGFQQVAARFYAVPPFSDPSWRPGDE